MNIAIVEDEPAHSRLLQQYIEKWGRSYAGHVRVFCYESAEQFLFCMEDQVFDAVFADIQMPGMNGMDMVRKLRGRDERLPVIFTTGAADYMQEGYEVAALHYLLKPISEEKVFACLERACRQKREQDYYMIRSWDGPFKAGLRDINYCEAVRHDTIFVMTDRTGIHSMSGISDVEKELPEKLFMRCHRSYLCNIGNIRRITQEGILFDNGDTIPVSRRLYREVNRRFIEFFKRGKEA